MYDTWDYVCCSLTCYPKQNTFWKLFPSSDEEQQRYLLSWVLFERTDTVVHCRCWVCFWVLHRANVGRAADIGFEILTVAVMKKSIFWDIMPFSLLKVNQRFKRTIRLHLQVQRITQALLSTCFMLVSCLGSSSNLKMRVTHSSEKSADFQQTRQWYVSEDRTHQCCWCFQETCCLIFWSKRTRGEG
jgi:hypothetical protein